MSFKYFTNLLNVLDHFVGDENAKRNEMRLIFLKKGNFLVKHKDKDKHSVWDGYIIRAVEQINISGR
jgi:hypothetical protein